ncbi:hypothetical protein [Amycolatopsis methanolica]|uniref:Flp pilus assembly protein RcpC/CpaB domain-containing protein n=1 Tax=Amycolatopsis methanolica 239 TaxID=1068978 RepID=A0A076MZY3_AMYME|nr:hypothetical protein [Amycolatopsis methanolica]AIJ26148.1 hypothetical protein AMETH_6056 [Amycolatopsis methanolica 239]
MRFDPRAHWNRLRPRLGGRRWHRLRKLVAAGLLITAAVLAARPDAAEPRAAPPPPSAHVPFTGDLALAAVPVRLADTGVAELLTPGMRVDVVTFDESVEGRKVLASMASVLSVRPPPAGAGRLASARDGPLVVLSLPEETAREVAAMSLRNPVAVTLR